MASVELKSDVAGTVWKIVRAPGDKVAIDEPILILESMKMEIPVASPGPGVVKQILVKEGETVGEGAVVARLEV